MSRSKIFLVGLVIGISLTCYLYTNTLKSLLSPPSLSSSSSTTALLLLLSTKASHLPLSTTSSLPLSTTSPSVSYIVVEMDDRTPIYKIATDNGAKPYANGDKAQATVIKYLKLVETCKADPSLVVVDVGGFLGDFGLYAAACGCQVFIFEVQPNMAELIRTSVALNNFSTSRVHVINKAVNSLPSNSQINFNMEGPLTTTSNGTLRMSTIRLDDVEWPLNSTIIMLKVDVEGLELDILRSAEKLFREKRIHHLIFEYTAWWTDRAAQRDLIPFVKNTLGAKQLFALDRLGTTVYGPLTDAVLEQFHDDHARRHLQTDIYACFVELNETSSLEIQSYNLGSSFA